MRLSIRPCPRPYPGAGAAIQETSGCRPSQTGYVDSMAESGGKATSGRPIAVVTGASAGVGRAAALALAQAGFDLGLLARGRAGLDAAAKDVEAAGGRAVAIPTDVAEFDDVERAADTVEQELGAIDVWVNDAMTTVFAPVWEVDPYDFARAVQVTFLGQVWGTKVALGRMLPRDRGRIVNVGSAMAFIGIPLQSAYCASKFACRGFFESTRAELIHRGSNVTMSMVHLPAVNTTQFNWCETVFDRHPQPVPPIYQPEVPAKFIVEAALDGRRAKVLGSWNKILVAASKLMPAVGNQYAAIGAWETQLTDQPVAPDRPTNLWEPADGDMDHGYHGMFDDKAGGFLDPHFLRTLPKTGRKFGKALVATAREKASRYRAG
ncbi:MAG TPA: SDR family oxidoreductase [Acidimicrobiales bacterium]|nr:SDR family oxidoreductase [Acidimicrobiales bacterium]